MALFQKSVLKKYLKTLDDKKVKAAYDKYVVFFQNEEIIRNIREGKEEQFQYGFLDNLFVNVLGYTIRPNEGYNLTTELKNLKGSKKADGAIMKDGKAVGVIELKSTKTKELSKITDQAFGYKNNHPTCVYIITSNFEKLRFYINDAVEHLDFDLFTLTEEQFKLLYLCLHKDHILADLPQKIKKASTLKEEEVTKQLYKDYSAFKKVLFNDMVANNPELDKLTLFKKSQKLLDRFLFIFFAEDKGLLPPNSISKIVKRYERLKEEDFEKPLYDIFKQYFGYINSGRPAKGDRGEIFAFNGGLFAPDEILDKVKITDNLLEVHTLLMSKRDFESDIDVNILGHIFEHSLNEIDEMTAQLEGQEINKKKTKRKKDGVFYTPNYITKYIVDNTVGKLCEKKKIELKLNEIDFSENYKLKKARNIERKIEMKTQGGDEKIVTKKDKTYLSVKGEEIENKITDYRRYILDLTICDPACGSGAFLNQALDFLLKEHKYIDELLSNLKSQEIKFPYVEKQILEGNLYGVDINEESVEIARLSLWLRTAQKGRALTTLSNNIKCGNSLIDDPIVAGNKAFNWEKEFPEVFKNGGFDVVIGNPPYVNMVNIENANHRKYFLKNFKTAKNKCDLYSLFIEKGGEILKTEKLLGFIFPNSWMGTSSFSKLREYITIEKTVLELIELPADVFKDATVTTVIMILKNSIPPIEHDILLFQLKDFLFQQKDFNIKLKEVKKTKSFSYSFEKQLSISGDTIPLGDIATFTLGIKTSNDKRFIFHEKKDENFYPILRGKNINRYSKNNGGEFIWYMPELIKEKAGGRPRVLEHYINPKIIIQDIAKKINATFDDENFLVNDTINSIYKINEKFNIYYILALLNSKAINKWFSINFSEGLHIKINQLQEIPIAKANEKIQTSIANKVSTLLSKNKILSEANSKIYRTIKRRFEIDKLTRNLQNWHKLTFAEFVKELKKKKVKLSLGEESEWEDYFEAEKAKAQTLQSEIDKTDKEIDQMVYALYGLTEEEIGIVEGS